MRNYVKTIKMVVLLIGTYIINFLLLPLIFMDITTSGVNAAAIISTIAFSVIGFIFITDKLRYWLLSNIICFLLAVLYHPQGIYGIGIPLRIGFPIVGSESLPYDRSVAWIGVVVFVVEIFIIQVLIW